MIARLMAFVLGVLFLLGLLFLGVVYAVPGALDRVQSTVETYWVTLFVVFGFQLFVRYAFGLWPWARARDERGTEVQS